MLDVIDFKSIDRLSKYRFHLGVLTSHITIAMPDETNISSAEYLYIQENGSPLQEIVATRPIEKTYLLLKQEIFNTYDRCIKGIIEENWSNQQVDFQMIDCANKLKNMLRMQVDSKIKNDIDCKVFISNRKIN